MLSLSYRIYMRDSCKKKCFHKNQVNDECKVGQCADTYKYRRGVCICKCCTFHSRFKSIRLTIWSVFVCIGASERVRRKENHLTHRRSVLCCVVGFVCLYYLFLVKFSKLIGSGFFVGCYFFTLPLKIKMTKLLVAE